jgi:4-hydroxybenzoate polyprenyltransferase
MSNSSLAAGTLSTLTGLVRETRPQQWYKQGVLLLGITFSRNLLNPEAWTAVLFAIVGFTAVAGATYVINDIADVEADRNHPEKRHRPIASGQVPVPVAAAFAAALLIGGFGLALAVGPLLVAVLGTYLGQNLLYSTYIKHVAFADVISVAVGFVLRAIAGVVAIGVFLSPWLIVCTFLSALVLALGKRRHELGASADPQRTRETLGSYTAESVDQLLTVVTATLLMAYALYTFDRADPTMMLTLPFAFFGVFRYHHLVHTTEIAGRPEFLFTDRPSMLNLALWAATAVAALYGLPNLLVEVLS